jgi:hypothetical protein
MYLSVFQPLSPFSLFFPCLYSAWLFPWGHSTGQLSRGGAVVTASPGTVITHGLVRLYPCLLHYPHVTLFHLPCAGGKQTRSDRDRAGTEHLLTRRIVKPMLNKSVSESRTDTRCQLSTKLQILQGYGKGHCVRCIPTFRMHILLSSSPYRMFFLRLILTYHTIRCHNREDQVCVSWVRERTITIERPPLVGEVSATWSAWRIPTAVFSDF